MSIDKEKIRKEICKSYPDAPYKTRESVYKNILKLRKIVNQLNLNKNTEKI